MSSVAPVVIVTADTPAATRRWRETMRSTCLRVYQPGTKVSEDDLPAVAVHIFDQDIYLSWTVPCFRSQVRKELKRRHEWSEAWLRKNAADEKGCRIHRQARDAVHAACEAGWGIPGTPGDVTWIECTERDVPMSPEFVTDVVPYAIAQKMRKLAAEIRDIETA
jgi:hypothetical protein